MNFNNHSYPHPILRSDSDDIQSNIGFKSEPNLIQNADSYFVEINLNHDNRDLHDLVKKGFAIYFCEATCSDTLYRDTLKSNSEQFTFIIPKKMVKGRVVVSCKIVAKKPIIDYKNSNQHTDYGDEIFSIEIGDPLALFDDFRFDFDIFYEKINNPSQFMNVVENTSLEISGLPNIHKDKIEIQLSTKDYNIFVKDDISKNIKFATPFQSHLALPALLHALNNFDEVDGDLLWKRVIEYRLQHDSNLKGLSPEDKGSIPELALRLLGNPISRVLTEIEESLHETNEEEL